MAFLEVIKHTRKIWSVAMVKEKSWLHKAGEILIEILIIVFAISFSLFLERQREESNDRKLEKDFFAGLNYDLKQDANQLHSDKLFYSKVQRGFSYFMRLTDTSKLSADSVNLYYNYLMGGSDYNPNAAHYQALKSTGKLYIIENKALLNQIIDLYENKIPALTYAVHFLNAKKDNGIVAYADARFKVSAKTNNIKEVMTDPIAKNYLRQGGYLTEILMQYDDAIKDIASIEKSIAKQKE